jgi:hypothetical protein
MAEDVCTSPRNEKFTWRGVVGGALVSGGVFLLAGQLLHLGWLAGLAGLAAGLFLLQAGVRARTLGYLISGALVSGFGLGLVAAFGLAGAWTVPQRLGIAVMFSGVGFGLVDLLMRRVVNLAVWWPVIPMAVLVSAGACLLATPAGVLDFSLFISLGLGLALLEIGLTHQWIGLIIPGCLVAFTGLGVYVPWETEFGGNALAKTGGMLVLFAFGWAFISVFSRLIHQGFIWWPLIPGGVLAVVGWGLYSGGNPSHALQFIGNTGTAAILILGFYLLMMRRGIR